MRTLLVIPLHILCPSITVTLHLPRSSWHTGERSDSGYHLSRQLGVGALILDVTRLLALVADLLATAGVLGAIARVMAGLATVVAFAAVDAITYKR